jgi:hypothetical protein
MLLLVCRYVSVFTKAEKGRDEEWWAEVLDPSRKNRLEAAQQEAMVCLRLRHTMPFRNVPSPASSCALLLVTMSFRIVPSDVLA